MKYFYNISRFEIKVYLDDIVPIVLLFDSN